MFKNLSVSIRALKIFSLLYLIIPNLIFLNFWVIGSIGIPCILLIVLGAYQYFKLDKSTISSEKDITLSPVQIVGILGLAAFFTLISGAGGFSDQVYDYISHNTKFNDLYVNDWPFKYKSANSYPCYYFGYYLFPALLAKAFNHVRILSMIWMCFGLFITTSWIYVLIGKKSLLYIFVFLLWGGLYTSLSHFYDIVFGSMKVADLYWSDFRPMSDGFLLYMPVYLSSVWVPNQFIPACIVMSVIAFEIFFEKKGYKSIALIPLLAIWAPFPALGITIITLGFFIQETISKKQIQFIWKDYSPALIMFFGCLPIFLYLMSTKSGETAKGFLWNFDQKWASVWLLFVLTEFGITTLAVYFSNRNNHKNEYNQLLFPVLLFLIFLPLIHFGRNNDLAVRANIPAFFLLNIYLTHQFIEIFKTKKLMKWVISIIFLIGSIVPLKVMWRGSFNNKLTGEPKTYFLQNDMYGILRDYYSPTEANQYLADENSFFIQYLQKK
ncbi:MAG: hypothetical protein V4683_03830 [Bacteroidota bacterium]